MQPEHTPTNDQPTEPAPCDVLLDAAQVCERYRLADPRAARGVIRQAGGRRIAGKWMIRLDVLRAFETSWTDGITPADAAQLRTTPLGRSAIPKRLDHHWWQAPLNPKDAA